MELTNKQKAELTYAALQKRKMCRQRKNENMATEVHIALLYKCKKRARNRYSPGLKVCKAQS